MSNFEIKDSGARVTYASGMTRDADTDKIDYSTVFNGPMLRRWAELMTKGAKKYPDAKPGLPNWMLADSEEELVRAKKSTVRHFVQWLRGDVDEDHASAVFFGINLVEFLRV